MRSSSAPSHAGLIARSSTRLHRLLTKLERPWARRFSLAFALLLVAPALFSGFALDDYVLLYQMAPHPGGEWAGSMPFDLFRWMDAAHDRLLIDGAGLPWWTFAQATCAFLRPLSSLTHTLDHWLWPSSAFFMHLQSVAWFALLLVLTAQLYLALLESRTAAAVASAMFALDSAHGEAVGWISNRNALISSACGVLALLCHHKSRSQSSMQLGFAAWLCFALGLLSGELGVGLAGYLFAYALLFEQGALKKRLGSMLPYALIFCAWAGLRSALHYGTFGLGVYVDPIKEPLAFARELPTRAVILISSQVSRLSSDLYQVVPEDTERALLAIALLVCVATLIFVWPSLRARRSLRFWAVGAALSVLPMTATLPGDRLLALVGVGVMPVLAQAVLDAFAGLQASKAPAHAETRRAGYAHMLVLVHFVIDPVMLPLMTLSPALIAQTAEAADASLPTDPRLRKQSVIVAAVPDSAILSYLPVMRSFNGKPRPDKLYWLSAIPAATRIERRGPNLVRVIGEEGLFDRRSESRSPSLPFHPGDRVELREMTIEIVALTKDGRPAVCDFHFVQAPESPSYLWLTWRAGHLEPFPVPKQGQSAKL